MTEIKKKYNEKVLQLNNTFFLHQKHKTIIVVFALLFVLTHFISMAMFPHSFMASKTVLIVVVGMMFYIWIQEIKDKRKLQFLNKNLITAHGKLERSEFDMIKVLILTAEAKDPYTHGHSNRVAEYSLEITKALKLSEAEQKLIERAAILHDLGKIGIDDNILKKESRLTDEEWSVMKEHPAKGVKILKPLKFLSKEKKIILYHHERPDGKGYPAGLEGDVIPLGSQIIAVADTFDAMNSSRSYRKALSKEIIIEELTKVSGSQLSEKITKVFLDLLEEKFDFWSSAEERSVL